MNQDFLRVIAAGPDDRQGLFLTAANRLGTPLQNVEKDFWVTWVLDLLFNGRAADEPRLLFKGGTDLSGYEDPMFPPHALWSRYAQRAQRKMPQMGDMSARSALTIHRGTANRSNKSRPILVIGVDAPDARNAQRHDLQVTRAYFDQLPSLVQQHLSCRMVEVLQPLVQAHTIEGLVMGAE